MFADAKTVFALPVMTEKPYRFQKACRRAKRCVDADSALGFEPLMGYAGDRAHIEWKIRQVKRMLTEKPGRYEQGLQYCRKRQSIGKVFLIEI